LFSRECLGRYINEISFGRTGLLTRNHALVRADLPAASEPRRSSIGQGARTRYTFRYNSRGTRTRAIAGGKSYPANQGDRS